MSDDVRGLLDRLDALRAEPERVCQWCMARQGEWCESDCANPERQCHPSYVADFAAERGAYSDHDAALIVAAVNAAPALVAALRGVLDLADRAETGGERDAFRDFEGNAWPLSITPEAIRSVVAAALDGVR